MGEWANSNLVPKRAHRFILSIQGGNGAGALEEWVVSKVSRPSFSVSEVEHNFWDKKYYYPGRVAWDPCTVTLVDPLVPDTSATLMSYLMASGYRFPNSSDAVEYRSLSKTEGKNALGDVILRAYGVPGGAVLGDEVSPADNADIVEQFQLHNAFITGVNFGEFDYSSDELVQVELTMRYDWASISLPGTATFPASTNSDIITLASPGAGDVSG